jgi:AcrR family transcriptional regulator
VDVGAVELGNAGEPMSRSKEPEAPAPADLEPAARQGKPSTYSSPAIRERRRRILEETRRMIADEGLANFNMNELCKRAEVAKRTLYNAFQTREQLIASAISEYFEEYVQRIPYSAPEGTLHHNLERLISVSQRNVRIPNYIRAIMSIYFSADSESDIWKSMQAMAVRPTLAWLQQLATRRQLQAGIEPELLANDLVRLEYAVINDWSLGRIPDEELTPHLLTSFLTYVAGATRGAANAEIRETIVRIKEDGVPQVPGVGRARTAA